MNELLRQSNRRKEAEQGFSKRFEKSEDRVDNRKAIAGGRRNGDAEDLRQKKRDNVNQYAVKKKLEQRKVERTQTNSKQI